MRRIKHKRMPSRTLPIHLVVAILVGAFLPLVSPLGSCQEIQRLKGRLGDPVDAQGANEG